MWYFYGGPMLLNLGFSATKSSLVNFALRIKCWKTNNNIQTNRNLKNYPI